MGQPCVPSSADGAAPARTALVGNPSDGYGGAVLSVALPELGARATAAEATATRITPPSLLVEATIRRFGAGPAEVKWATTVPPGVGLGGSSAIAIAVLRALCGLHGVELDPDQVAALALAVEREDLQIAGGRQDQIAEAYGGLTLMDFARERHERLDSALLPPLVVAWRTDLAEPSGLPHADLRARYTAGDQQVRACLEQLTPLTFAARDALTAGDREAFARAVDRTFDLRAQLMPLDPRHVALVECARGADAAANYTGSGGAVVAVCTDEAHRRRVLDALASAGCSTLTAGA